MRRSRRDRPLAGVPGSDIYEAERSPERLRGVPGSAPLSKSSPGERAAAAIQRHTSRWPQLRDRFVEELNRTTQDATAARALPPSAAHTRVAGPAPALDARPARRMAIVTCMDPRVDVLRALNLGEGDAHVLRNAGGIVSDDVIRSLAVSQHLQQTREIILVHHTDCGMQQLDGARFRAELQAEAGIAPPFDIGAIDDLEADVRRSILRVQRSPFLPHRDRVHGYVYDVDSHRLREVRML